MIDFPDLLYLEEQRKDLLREAEKARRFKNFRPEPKKAGKSDSEKKDRIGQRLGKKRLAAIMGL